MKIQSALRSISLPCLASAGIPRPITGGIFGAIIMAVFVFASVAVADIVTGLDAGGPSQVKTLTTMVLKPRHSLRTRVLRVASASVLATLMAMA
jgi:hypothetical protein